MLVLKSMSAVVSLLAAGSGQAIDTGLADCRSIADPMERVSCYDAYVDRSALIADAPSAIEASGVTERVSVSPQDEIKTPEQRFGFSPAQLLRKREERIEKPKELSSLNASIVSVSSAGNGRLRVTLNNGQVWRQTGDDAAIRLSKRNEARMETAEIEKNNFGNFWMKIKPLNRKIRVERVK